MDYLLGIKIDNIERKLDYLISQISGQEEEPEKEEDQGNTNKDEFAME